MKRWLCLFICLASCQAFNRECTIDDSEVIAQTAKSLELQKIDAEENIFGDIVADALLDFLPQAQLALVAAGNFDRSTSCGQRDFIDAGPIRSGLINTLMPQNDTVVLITVTSDELKRALEHSVAEPSGPQFLQVAQLSFAVDCSQLPQQLTPQGQILFPGSRTDFTQIRVQNQPLQVGGTLQVATLSSLANGAYGYVEMPRAGRITLDSQKPLRAVVSDYLRKNKMIAAPVENRITLLDTCQ